MIEYTLDHLLNKQVQILQPVNGYRASTDAVFLAAFIKNIKKGDNILDVGSGTGAVSLCLAKHFPDNDITGLEIQPDLVWLSQQSAALNNFANLNYINADIRSKKSVLHPCSFSHVITNPPYYQNTFQSPNAGKAFAHAHQDFNLEGWLKFCLKMLRPFGRLFMINRPEALEETLKILSKRAGAVEIFPVYSKPDQPAKRIILAAQKDSKTPLKIHPPFYIHNPDGSHTKDADRILIAANLFFDH